MLKPLFVTSSLAPGGAERHAVSVMNLLAERGHECHALYIKSPDNLLDRLSLRKGGTARCLDAVRYLDRHALARFADHLSRLRPSVIVAANPYSLMYAWLARQRARLRVPLVTTYHSTQLAGLKRRLQMMWYCPLFWAADCTVFLSEKQRRYCVARGAFSRRMEVIPNGIDLDHYRQGSGAAEGERLRSSLGLSNSDYVIGICAILRPEKNHVQLVDALGLLRQRGIRARALMIGDGETRPAVEARARKRGLEGDVLITGMQADVRPYLSACDVVVLCSVAVETFSLAALEAMALGKPVVHSDVGGAIDMIVPDVNGYLFPAGDTGALAARLTQLADRDRRSLLGRNARERVERLYSDKIMADRYEQTLLSIMEAAAPKGLWTANTR